MYLVLNGKVIVNCKSTSGYDFLGHVHHALIVSVRFIHLSRANKNTVKSISYVKLNTYISSYK